MASDGLVSHWKHMPEWHPERRMWVFYATFADHLELHALVRKYQAELRGIAGLDLVESRWLHLTIQGTAFTDQLTNEQFHAIGDEVRAIVRRTPPPLLTLAPPTPDHDAITMQVEPTEPIHQLRADICAGITRAAGEDKLYRLPEPQGGFNPHITIAYVNSPIESSRQIATNLGRVEHPDMRLHVEHLSMVKLGRELGRWFWEDERPLRFGADALAAG